MTRLTVRTATWRIIALITCLSLVIGGLAIFDGGSQYSAQVASAVAQDAATPTTNHAGHNGAHHAAATDAGSEHCPSANAQASGCHASGCCPAELQPAPLPAPEILARSANRRPFVTSSIRLQGTSLPERPPRTL